MYKRQEPNRARRAGGGGTCGGESGSWPSSDGGGAAVRLGGERERERAGSDAASSSAAFSSSAFSSNERTSSTRLASDRANPFSRKNARMFCSDPRCSGVIAAGATRTRDPENARPQE